MAGFFQAMMGLMGARFIKLCTCTEVVNTIAATSISPDTGLWEGRTIISLLSPLASTFNFRFQLSGTTVAQNWFTRLIVFDDDGETVRRVLNTADATFTSNTWDWGDGSDPIWDVPVTSGQTRLVIFER